MPSTGTIFIRQETLHGLALCRVCRRQPRGPPAIRQAGSGPLRGGQPVTQAVAIQRLDQ